MATTTQRVQVCIIIILLKPEVRLDLALTDNLVKIQRVSLEI